MGPQDKKNVRIFILFLLFGITFCCVMWALVFGGAAWLYDQMKNLGLLSSQLELLI